MTTWKLAVLVGAATAATVTGVAVALDRNEGGGPFGGGMFGDGHGRGGMDGPGGANGGGMMGPGYDSTGTGPSSATQTSPTL